jgi:hypothetical protein
MEDEPSSTVFPFQCFSPDIETAEAYLDNPGFGGPVLVKVELPAGPILDMRGKYERDSFRILAEEIGYDDPHDEAQRWFDAGWRYPWDESKRVRKAVLELADRYDYLMYRDDYPAGATTIMPLKEINVISSVVMNPRWPE